MSAAVSDYGFPDCREFLNQALGAEKGWRATFSEKGHATSFRLRCYSVRRRERTFNKKFYVNDEMAARQTVWDGLVLVVRKTELGWAVLATKGAAALENATIEHGPIE